LASQAPTTSAAAEAPASAGNGNKRHAEDSPEEVREDGDSKRAKTGHIATEPKRYVLVPRVSLGSVPTLLLYRDREHCTMLVSGLSSNNTEAELRNLFRDVSV